MRGSERDRERGVRRREGESEGRLIPSSCCAPTYRHDDDYSSRASPAMHN